MKAAFSKPLRQVVGVHHFRMTHCTWPTQLSDLRKGMSLYGADKCDIKLLGQKEVTSAEEANFKPHSLAEQLQE